MKKNNGNQIHEGIKDYLPRIKADINGRFPMIGSFLVLSIFLKLILKNNFSTTICLIVFLILLFSFVDLLIFKKFEKKSPQIVIDSYFANNCLDVLLLAVVIYLLGGIGWIGPFFYSLVIINIFWLFPKDKAIFLITLCLLSLIILVGLQYFRFLPDFYIFSPEKRNMQDFYYAFATTIASLAIIFFLSYYSDIFRRILDNQILNLEAAKRKLTGTKKKLEDEANSRTEELAKEKRRLEIEITTRTRELEDRKKIAQERVRELERFHGTAVARELEMVRLKEQITKLKNKIKK